MAAEEAEVDPVDESTGSGIVTRKDRRTGRKSPHRRIGRWRERTTVGSRSGLGPGRRTRKRRRNRRRQSPTERRPPREIRRLKSPTAGAWRRSRVGAGGRVSPRPSRISINGHATPKRSRRRPRSSTRTARPPPPPWRRKEPKIGLRGPPKRGVAGRPSLRRPPTKPTPRKSPETAGRGIRSARGSRTRAGQNHRKAGNVQTAGS